MQVPIPHSGHRGGVYAVVKETRSTFLSAGSDGTVVRWQTGSATEGIAVAQLPRPVFSLAQRDNLMVAGLDDGSVHVLDTATRAETRNLTLHSKGVFACAWTDNGARLLSLGGEGSLAVWHWPTMDLERQILLSEAKLRCAAISTNGHWLAVSANDGRVHVLDTADFNELITLDAHEGGAYGLAFHPTKPVLLTGGRDGKLCAWKMDGQWKRVLEIPAHQGSIYSAMFSPDGSRLATASRDKTIKVWDATSMDPLMKLDRSNGGHTHSVNALVWLSDQWLVSVGDDKRVLQWYLNR
ncbi:MAG: WD40 repeat domain-containing protein [Flavobacteriales bacterium]|nr:MAG: WD40 repeat domain-containing protein [Flavobacteriales bacterium]